MSHVLSALSAQRAVAALTTDQLAVKTGLSAAYLARAEQGNPLPVGESAKVAGVLGVSLATLGKSEAR